MYFVSFFIGFITYKSSMTFHLNDFKKIDVISILVKSLFFCFLLYSIYVTFASVSIS